MLKNMNCIIIIIIITLEGIKKIKTEKKWQQRSLNNFASMRAEDFKISISPREMHHHARQNDDKSVEPLTFKTGKTALKKGKVIIFQSRSPLIDFTGTFS